MRQAPQRSNVVAAGSGAAFEKRCPHALTPWQVRGRSTLCCPCEWDPYFEKQTSGSRSRDARAFT